jgi:DNA-binding Lrp family transcriptional regulator
MDEIDRKLLGLLTLDGRASISDLAKALKVSRGTVQNRIDRMIGDGVIAGFTVRAAAPSDVHTVRAMMLVEIAGHKTQAVIKALRGVPEIRALYSTHGKWDLVAEVEAANLSEFDTMLRQVRSMEGISKTETSLLMRRL